MEKRLKQAKKQRKRQLILFVGIIVIQVCTIITMLWS